MNDAFKGACSELEKLALAPQAIILPLSQDAMHDAVDGSSPDGARFQFQPL
jgi:hypothetical protein